MSLKPVTPESRALADRIVQALLNDELIEGYDLEAGMFGTQFSQLIIELAALGGPLYAELAAERDTLRKQLTDLTHALRVCQTELGNAREEASDARTELHWLKDRSQWGQ